MNHGLMTIVEQVARGGMQASEISPAMWREICIYIDGLQLSWRPMETAPKDGGSVLVFDEEEPPFLCWWDVVARNWRRKGDTEYGEAVEPAPQWWSPFPQGLPPIDATSPTPKAQDS